MERASEAGREDGERFMRRALELARRGLGLASPNPMVGAVVLAGGRVVGEGWHEGPGTPHAEVRALEAAGERARGATLYVTLEPCSHWGRTPPCAPRVAAAGIARLVAGTLDPNPIVDGAGVKHLREAGLSVEVGELETDARELMAGGPFLPPPTRDAWERSGAEVLVMDETDEDGMLSLPALMAALGKRAIQNVLIEGGPTVAGSAIGSGIVDRFVLYVAPKLIG